jgi:hypothetical protein
MGAMAFALLLCSDDACAELFEAHGPWEELLALACSCGATLEVVRIWDAEDAAREVLTLAPVG